MRRITNIIIGVWAFLCLPSCSLLDTQPLDFTSPENYYQTEEELNSALRGVYTTIKSSALYGDNMAGRMGLDADISFVYASRDVATVSDYDVVATDPKVLSYWRELYNGINQANVLLANINKPKMSETKRDLIKGQALFLRGYYYLMLGTRFGGVPLVLVPAPSSKLEDVQIPASSQRKIYEHVISDMKTAAPLLQTITEAGFGGIANRSAAYGLIARTALYMAGQPINATEMYAEVTKYTKLLIESGEHSLNPSYEDVFINYAQDKYDIKESIFEVEFWGNDLGTYGRVGGYITCNMGIVSGKDTKIGFCNGSVNITQSYYDMFDRDNDLRFPRAVSRWTYNANSERVPVTALNSVWGFKCAKYRREDEVLTPKGVYASPVNFPILRYSDVLLMFTEAYAADPENTQDELMAYDCINQVRRRAYGKPVDTPDAIADIPVAPKEELLMIIRDERARELGHELLRKDDVIRWGIFYEQMQFNRRQVPEGSNSHWTYARNTYTNAQPRDVLWPIPSYELGVNRNLKQNPGW